MEFLNLPECQGMEATCRVIVDDTECAYFDKVKKLDNFGAQNKESIMQLLWAFFHYWAYCHDYTNDVISVRTGRIIRYAAFCHSLLMFQICVSAFASCVYPCWFCLSNVWEINTSFFFICKLVWLFLPFLDSIT